MAAGAARVAPECGAFMLMLIVSIVDASTVNRELLDIPFGQRVIERPPLARRAEPRSALRGPAHFASASAHVHAHALLLRNFQVHTDYVNRNLRTE